MSHIVDGQLEIIIPNSEVLVDMNDLNFFGYSPVFYDSIYISTMLLPAQSRVSESDRGK